MTFPSRHQPRSVSHCAVRDGSVVTLTGCKQQMVVKSVEGFIARCAWLDFDMNLNEYSFPTENLERVSW